MSRKKQVKAPLSRIEADPAKGLNAAEVEERRQKGYVNVQLSKNEKSVPQIIAGNLFTFFNVVLFTIAMMFVGFMIYLSAIHRDDIINTYFGFSKFVFVIPAVMNVTIGSFQEIQSLKVIKKLRIVTETKSRVIRDGQTLPVDAKEIVLDDIVFIAAGDQATADMIVLEGEIFVDESMLTGEADHIKKVAGDKILSGSAVIAGDARCRVTEIGDDTYAAGLTQKVKSGSHRKSEIMSSIMTIIKGITCALAVVQVVIFVTLIIKVSKFGSDPSVWGGFTLSLSDPASWSLILLTGGTFGIGMIPSGLVLTSSVAMMVSIAQLTRKKTLIQELYSLENLSRVDIICLDKTGTLTDGTMTVAEVKAFIPDDEVAAHAKALMAAAGERNATAEAIYQRFGIDENAPIKKKIPFSSAVKYSGLIYEDGRTLLMGAPEYLLDKDDPELAYSSEQATKGKRVVALTLDKKLIAFIAIEDHIRDTAPDTLKFFRENGVTVKVISGDNPLTVSKIAQQCGIKHADRYISLAGVPLEDIPEIAEDYTVFARVSPEQKEALVRALQEKGHKVAMTGDGVNDILALRRSDSSITFAKATEAAKSCSDVVLLDNDFSHLKEVVGEGRRVISNIQKTAVLYLMKTFTVFIFAFALIPFAKGQMWLSIENLYMLEASVIGTGGFLLSLEPMRRPIKGSFIKNILSHGAAAGSLTATAILLPILLNVVPPAFGAAPFISEFNVRTMMTILITIAGFVVVFSMCLPFNRYRAFIMSALVFVATFLGLLIPNSYIGGNTVGKSMLSFNKEAGETILNSQLIREMFRPNNSEVIKNLFADGNNFVLLRIFLYVAVPFFILLRFAIENYTRKNYGKDVKLNRGFRIARRMALTSGFTLILYSFYNIIALSGASFASVSGYNSAFSSISPALAAVRIFEIILFAAIGYMGYKVWKDPTKKIIKYAFGAALILVAATAVKLILYIPALGILTAPPDTPAILLITIFYFIGVLHVFTRRDLGLDKKRDE